MRSKKGFTLIELMIVMTIIAILATIALFGLGKAQGGARDTQRQQIMNGIRAALERYYGDNYQYPANLGSVVPSYMPGFTDPGCGGGTIAYPAGNITSWSVNGGGCAGPAYNYAQGAGTYQLTLFKEGGGSSVFNSPR